jgi:hypothetical protein
VKTDRPADDRYGDLMGDDRDPALLRAVTALDVLAGAPAPSPQLSARIDRALEAAGPERGALRWRNRRLLAPLAFLLIAAILAGGVIAANNVVNLGKPGNVVSPLDAFPLSGFHRVHGPLLSGKPTQVLFIGTLHRYDAMSQAERWPMLKALEQFGTFSGVKAVDRDCSRPTPSGVCSDPTFDWSRARYVSKYLTFLHVDLLSANGKPYQKLTSRELALYNRYARAGAGGGTIDPYGAYVTMSASLSPTSSHALPLIVIGHYVQTISQIVLPGDFLIANTPLPVNSTTPVGMQGLPFSEVHSDLLHGSDPTAVHLVEDVNAETNIITALICHADGGRPGSVCSRPVVKRIAKYIK